KIRKIPKIKVIINCGASVTNSIPTGIPIKVPIESCFRTGRSTFSQPDKIARTATEKPVSPTKAIDVFKSTGSNANKGMLTTESPNPEMARIKAPRKTALITNNTMLISIITPFNALLFIFNESFNRNIKGAKNPYHNYIIHGIIIAEFSLILIVTTPSITLGYTIFYKIMYRELYMTRYLKVDFDSERGFVEVDRTNVGIGKMNETKATRQGKFLPNKELKMNIFVDTSSVEIFFNDGLK